MSDYDFEPRQAPSAFLTLKEKGDKITIRIASPPYREPKVWKADSKPPMATENMLKLTEEQWMTIYRDPDYNVTETFSWKVIDRDSGLAKLFSGTPGVYKSIKEYAVMDGWGDPTTYDFTIERTEQPGRGYYKVTALPNKDPLTDKEKELLDALDISEKLPAAQLTSERQVDYIEEAETNSAAGDEPSGYDKAKAKSDELKSKTHTPGVADSKDDVVIEDIGDEPINLDDIPF